MWPSVRCWWLRPMLRPVRHLGERPEARDQPDHLTAEALDPARLFPGVRALLSSISPHRGTLRTRDADPEPATITEVLEWNGWSGWYL